MSEKSENSHQLKSKYSKSNSFQQSSVSTIYTSSSINQSPTNQFVQPTQFVTNTNWSNNTITSIKSRSKQESTENSKPPVQPQPRVSRSFDSSIKPAYQTMMYSGITPGRPSVDIGYNRDNYNVFSDPSVHSTGQRSNSVQHYQHPYGQSFFSGSSSVDGLVSQSLPSLHTEPFEIQMGMAPPTPIGLEDASFNETDPTASSPISNMIWNKGLSTDTVSGYNISAQPSISEYGEPKTYDAFNISSVYGSAARSASGPDTRSLKIGTKSFSPPLASQPMVDDINIETPASLHYGDGRYIGHLKNPFSGISDETYEQQSRQLHHLHSSMSMHDIRKLSKTSMGSLHSISATSPESSNRISQERRYQCPVCNKYFRRDLPRHLRTHQEVGRFVCPFPSETCPHRRGHFNRPYDFKKHLLSGHFAFDDERQARSEKSLLSKLELWGTCRCGQRFAAKNWIENHVLGKKCILLRPINNNNGHQEHINNSGTETVED